MDLTIIIPSYNTKDLLNRCLHSIYSSLKNSSFRSEIIVIDNGSEDGTRELLNTKYDRVIKVFNKENIGFGKANNIGIRMAKGTHVLLLNSDCVALGDAIPILYQFVKKHPRSFAGGKLLNEDGSPQPSCGPFYTLSVVFSMLFLKGDCRGVTRTSPTETCAVDWVSGACLLASKVSLLAVGLFDEAIFMYMEEIDLLYRAKKKGYTVYFLPDAQFTHTGAASSKNKKEPVVNIYRGLTYFYKKHRSRGEHAILNILLAIKAITVICITRLTGNRELRMLYEKALGTL